MSAEGNQFILVIQDYFSKWPFVRAIPDQKAERTVQILRDDVFTLVGPPQRLHSDQGRNFESRILSDLCRAFEVKKSHTTPYHPTGDGLVERMNKIICGQGGELGKASSITPVHLQNYLLNMQQLDCHRMKFCLGVIPQSCRCPTYQVL